MAKTESERQYSRGYYRGIRSGRERLWPDCKPPIPPNEQIAAVMLAAEALRDAVDSQMAMCEPDDPLVLELYKHVDRLDEAMAAITDFALAEENESP